MTDQSGQLIRARARTGDKGVVDWGGDVGESDAARQRWIQSQKRGVRGRKEDLCAVRALRLTAAFGGQDVGIGQPWLVTRDRDVHIVFQREFNGVLERDFKLAFVNQLFNAPSVRSIEFRNLDTAIRREQIRKRLWRALIVIFSDAQRHGNRWIRRVPVRKRARVAASARWGPDSADFARATEEWEALGAVPAAKRVGSGQGPARTQAHLFHRRAPRRAKPLSERGSPDVSTRKSTVAPRAGAQPAASPTHLGTTALRSTVTGSYLVSLLGLIFDLARTRPSANWCTSCYNVNRTHFVSCRTTKKGHSEACDRAKTRTSESSRQPLP